MKNITLSSNYSDVYREFQKLKSELFRNGFKPIEFNFIDKHCKVEYVSGNRYNNLCLKYTIGENFEFHSNKDYLFWLYIVLMRNNSKLVEFYDYLHLEDTNIVLMSELNIFAYYSYVLGSNYDTLLKKGDYQDISKKRKELVVNTYKILKEIYKSGSHL